MRTRCGEVVVDKAIPYFALLPSASITSQEVPRGVQFGQADVMFQAKRWALSRDGPLGGPEVLVYDISKRAAALSSLGYQRVQRCVF
jgi:hypothetical protein